MNIKRNKKLVLFFKEYRSLSVLTLGSIIIVLAYTFTKNIPEFFVLGEEIFFLFYSISIAIISNFIFSYFQIYTPKFNKYNMFIKRIINQLTQIKLRLENGPNEIYHLKYKIAINKIEDIPDDKLKSLIKDFDLLSETENRYFANTLHKMTILDMIKNDKTIINDTIDNILSRYGDLMDADLIDLLYKIQDCTYFSVIDHIYTIVNPVLPIIQPNEFDGDAFKFAQIKALCKSLNDFINTL